MMAPDMSIIIATRNRFEQLRDLLRSLAVQETHGTFIFEVLVVDNGSKDETRGVVKELSARFPASLRYAYAEQPGKSLALNVGIQQSRGNILVFTDDDILTTPNWLHALWACFAEAEADAVTGRVLPLWIGGRPAWLTDEAFRQIGGMGCIDWGPRRVSTMDRRDCRWVGGNMAIRRE
ncbi:MAG: glycosyltransferase family A protein, partial [Candidatus Binatia bacterium]